MLGNTSVIGLQWGDEGKGKIVDLLTEHFDIVVRYSGGANAGHTVIVGSERFALHLLPSGILRPGVRNVVGSGVALDPEIICEEIDGLRGRGVAVGDNLLISSRAHLVMPYHKKQDRLAEASLAPTNKIGTTAKGIGPCYADKMLRSSAFRVGDLFHKARFVERLSRVVADRNRLFAAVYGDEEPLDADRMAEDCLRLGERLAPHVADATAILHEAIANGERLLFEGAQGSMLDLDHGTFPFVTSSTCTSASIASGAGVAPATVKNFIGVVKAYATRVGGGPFPSELADATGDLIREKGHEYGTTTGRPRRCGWFDAFAVKYAIALSGVTRIALMHMDTLVGFDEVRICTGYRYRGETLRSFPSDSEVCGEIEPVWETLPGWDGDVAGAADFEELPAEARQYVDRLEALLGVPIAFVSVGPEREATLRKGELGIVN